MPSAVFVVLFLKALLDIKKQFVPADPTLAATTSALACIRLRAMLVSVLKRNYCIWKSFVCLAGSWRD